MNQIHIILAVEDLLSEIIARKLVHRANSDFQVSQCLCRGGYGYLKSKIKNFNQAAKGIAFFVLTDQDNPNECPPQKIAAWLNQPVHPNMIFRVAVMEVESWVLAHRDAFANFLSVPVARIPQDTDSIKNPKQFLLSLARRSRSRRLRDDLVPRKGSTATVGPDYNSQLSQFVKNYWDVNKAVMHSESLKRAYRRLKEFQQGI